MMTGPETLPLQVGFEKAWTELRKMVAGITLTPECAVCERKNACPVCAAMCLAETGSFSKKPEYVCAMFEQICNLTEEQLMKIGELHETVDSCDDAAEEDFCEY